jgi:hypothetical protein
MTHVLSVDGQRATRLRLVRPWTGVWFVEAELDGDAGPVVPLGRVVILVDGSALVGTVDPTGSAKFGERATVRVVGGGGGWEKRPKPKHWHNDAGVTRGAVVRATAAEVGEVATVAAEAVLGTSYTRSGLLAASQVLGESWHVDDAGATLVGPRAEEAAPVEAAVRVLDWDPGADRATLAAAALVRPGWRLEDPRFGGGARTIRDVETVYQASGTTITAWCAEAAPAGSVLGSVLGGLVRELSGVTFCRGYRYRVFGMAGRRVELQAVVRVAGVPDVLPVSMWPGVPGVHAELAPGAEVVVEFLEGDHGRPAIRAFVGKDGALWLPTSLEIDSLTTIRLSETGAGGVVVGAGAGAPVALAPAVEAWAAAVVAACAAHVPPIALPPLVCAAAKLKAT